LATLFFRLCGLVIGNGVEAVAIVLSSFMLGMALGNGLAARLGDRLARPFRVYALLELMIAASGLLLVLGLPVLPTLLAGLLRPFLDAPLLLNAIRGFTVFSLVMLPATAMGATLPVLVRALSARDPNFGRVLGRLYGWNTIGAVAGVLATEGALLGAFGVRGSGLVAAGFDVLAALAIVAVTRAEPRLAVRAGNAEALGRLPSRGPLLIAAAFACGASLLALEVVWFRLFLLFEHAYGWNLAVMLAVVLAGIATGGLASGQWFRLQPDAHRYAPLLALLAGSLVAVSYSSLGMLLADGVPRRIEWLYLLLTFPVAFVSGLLFPMLGRALQSRGVSESRATGWTTLANTLGSAMGSFVAGYLLLPLIGIEFSFFGLALGYGGVAGLLALAMRAGGSEPRARARPWPLVGLGMLWAVSLADFGFGDFQARILSPPGGLVDRLEKAGYERAALRDGITGTIQYFRRDLYGAPYEWALVTDSHTMAGATLHARRYMKLYVYWPAAFHPELRDALLISYGVGNTAQALTEQASLQHIDVVDISADILELTAMRFPPGRDPLSDPRVESHVEDGRFFLQTTPRRYDLITAEPPPPRFSGVENLYSQQYFELIRDRLREGGIVTYWLPVYQFYEREAKSVMRGFCEAFENCSLWIGTGLEWMMIGLKEPYASSSLESFARGWRDPATLERLVDIGLYEPHQLASLYIADGERLRSWMGDAEPLDDDHPHRIAPIVDTSLLDAQPGYDAFMNSPETEPAFRASETVARIVPPELRESAISWMPNQRLIEAFHARGARDELEVLHRSFSDERLAPYRAWLFGMDGVAREILRDVDVDAALRGELAMEVNARLAGAALARGELSLAERLLDAGMRTARQRRGRDAHAQVYLLLRMGKRDAAFARLAQVAAASRDDAGAVRAVRAFWKDVRRWLELEESFGEAVRRGREVLEASAASPR
jgi:spermidine synthase